MFYRPIRLLVTLVGVLSFLANVTVLGSGWVLCAESDGRVAVEFASDFNSCPTTPVIVCSAENEVCELIEANSNCACESDPCSDTPIGIEPAPLQKRIQLLDSLAEDSNIGLSSPYIPILQPSDTDRFVAMVFNAHPGHCARLLSLRKVVLLI